MVWFSHVWKPPVGYNLSAERSQIYLTYVIKDQKLAKEQAGEGSEILTRWGDKKDSYTGAHELLAPGPQFSDDVVQFLT